MPESMPQPFYTPVSELRKKTSNDPRQAIPPTPSSPLNPSPDSPLLPGSEPPNPSQPSIIPQPFSRSTIGTARIASQRITNPIGSLAPSSSQKPSQTPHFSETASQDPLVVQFTTLYNASLANSKTGNHETARQQYSEMLKLYTQFTTRPDMHEMNKDIAHFCVQDVYDTLSKTSDTGVAKLRFGALLGVTIVLLVIGGIIATNPSIVGLVTGFSIFGPPAPTWTGGESHVLITGPTTIHLADLFSTQDHAPLTFLATSGNGMDAVVSGNYVTLVPKYGVGGTTRISFIAARQDDPLASTKQAVDVTVA